MVCAQSRGAAASRSSGHPRHFPGVAAHMPFSLCSRLDALRTLAQGTVVVPSAPFLRKDTSMIEPSGDLSHIAGQDHVKRALEVAAAGRHSLALIGPPGVGKSL